MVYKQEIVFIPAKPKAVRMTIVDSLTKWQAETLAKLQQTPGAVKYPIRWTTERQRRAFFASKGFRKGRRTGKLSLLVQWVLPSRGIPTRRTGKLQKAWKVDINVNELKFYERFINQLLQFLNNVTPTSRTFNLKVPEESTIVTIENPIPYEQYVTGIHQQGFHADTGWIRSDVIIDNAMENALAISSDWVIE